MTAPRARRAETGSATVWVILAMALLAAVTAGALLLADVAAARQRAAAAADLAALAGAMAAERGADPCAAATRVAAADGAHLPGCSVAAGIVLVTASVPLPPAVAALGRAEVSVQARAGPGG